jgi:hypothetical protein
MLFRLHNLLDGHLQEMLADLAHPWKTVDVTYEDPHVERVWAQWGEERVSLHRIHPCTKPPLFHPHPWPSAMLICSGVYMMGVGRSQFGGMPDDVARLKLVPGAQYEMIDPHGWHWVQPLDLPVMSVMVTGKPWEMPEGFPKHGVGHVHKELSDEVRDDILNWFRQELGVFAL